MELFCDIYRVIEKVLELYLVINWFGEKKVKLYIKIIIQLKGDVKKLVFCSFLKLVVLVLFEILNRDIFEEELRLYVRYIWKWVIEFVDKLKLVLIFEIDIERENMLFFLKNI